MDRVEKTGMEGRNEIVVEFLGISCSGKSYLIDRVADRLREAGVSISTSPTPIARGPLGRARVRARAMWWAARLEPDWRTPRFCTVCRVLNRGFLMRGRQSAEVMLISEGLFHRVYFSTRHRVGARPALHSLAAAMAEGAPTLPDLLVHVTAAPEVLIERRKVRESNRSRQSTDLSEIRADIVETRDFVEPALATFANRYGFELLTIDNSSPDSASAVDRIIDRISTLRPVAV